MCAVKVRNAKLRNYLKPENQSLRRVCKIEAYLVNEYLYKGHGVKFSKYIRLSALL